MKKIHVGYHSPPFSWKHSLRKKKIYVNVSNGNRIPNEANCSEHPEMLNAFLKGMASQAIPEQPSTCVAIPFVPQPPCCYMYSVLMHADHYYCHPITDQIVAEEFKSVLVWYLRFLI